MNRQQQRKLKKHPLIRLIRGIFRLIRVIFRPAKNARLQAIELAEIERIELERAQIRQAEIERIELERAQIRQAEIEQSQILAAQQAALAERYITVGDLLNRVQWQSSVPKNSTVLSATKLSIPQAHDVSLN